MNDRQAIEVRAALGEIKEVYEYLSGQRSEYDFQRPVMMSNAQLHSSDTQQLIRYAMGAVSARIMQLLALTYMKTWFFLDLYLTGVDKRNPYALIFAARAQIESFAVVFGTLLTIRKNTGTTLSDLLSRVQAVDDALIRAIGSTKDERIAKLALTLEQNRARPKDASDGKRLKAVNILTYLERLKKNERYRTLVDDYDRFSDYLHPNLAQNMLLMWPSMVHKKLSKVSRTDQQIVETAVIATSRAMALAAKSSVEEFGTLSPPFPFQRAP